MSTHTPPAEAPTNPSLFVIGGNGRWGKGTTLVAAKAAFRAYGGRLSDGYTILTFDADTEFRGVDDLGRTHWNGNHPHVRDVQPRGSKR